MISGKWSAGQAHTRDRYACSFLRPRSPGQIQNYCAPLSPRPVAAPSTPATKTCRRGPRSSTPATKTCRRGPRVLWSRRLERFSFEVQLLGIRYKRMSPLSNQLANRTRQGRISAALPEIRPLRFAVTTIPSGGPRQPSRCSPAWECAAAAPGKQPASSPSRQLNQTQAGASR